MEMAPAMWPASYSSSGRRSMPTASPERTRASSSARLTASTGSPMYARAAWSASAIRTVATGRIADADQAARAYMGEPVEAVSRAELLARVRSGDAVVLDLRPDEEYEAGHIAGAISIPLAELEAHLADLPAGVEIVAYCRGPYCALAPQGVALLRRSGRHARRLEDGFPEWRLAGLPVVTGSRPA